MAEGRIQIIAELIDRLTPKAKLIESALRRIRRTSQTELPAIAEQGFVPLQKEFDKLNRRWERLESAATRRTVRTRVALENQMLAIQRALQQMEVVGLTASGEFFKRFDEYSRVSVTSGDRIRGMLVDVGRSFAGLGTRARGFIRGLERNMGSLAWTFTWASLSMMGVLWNFEWMLRVFLDPLKMVVDSLANFVDAAFNMAYWLALGEYFGLDFAEQLGGIDKAIQDVIESGMFLAATVGGLMAMAMVALARALKVPGVMEAITEAMNAVISVITDPRIITAIADIVKGIAEMVRTIIPMIPSLIPIVENFLGAFLDKLPAVLSILGTFIGMIPGLQTLGSNLKDIADTLDKMESPVEKLGGTIALLAGAFGVLQPVLVPVMFVFSAITAVLVQLMIWGKAASFVLGVLRGAADKLGISIGGLIARVGGLVAGLFYLARGLWDVVQRGWDLKNITDILVGAGWIIVALIGGPFSMAIMAVVTAIKMVIDYFDWWDEIIEAVTGAIKWLTNALSTLFGWLTRVTGPLSSLAGMLGIGGGRLAVTAGPSTQYVYQTVSIGTVRETADLDAVLRRLASSTRTSLGGVY